MYMYMYASHTRLRSLPHGIYYMWEAMQVYYQDVPPLGGRYLLLAVQTVALAWVHTAGFER